MRSVIVMALAAVGLMAADPAGFVVWKSGDLKGYEKKLGAKLTPDKSANETLANFGNHLTMIAHREGTGTAEVHEKMVDFFVVESGEATLVVGGKLVSPKTTAPNEIRGPSIEGGEKHKITTGDVVHIPANVPHHLLVDSGKQFTYFVIKVESK